MNFASAVWGFLGTLFRGVLLGAGFAIGFGLLYLSAFPPLSVEVDRRMREMRVQAQLDPKSIVLSELQEQNHEGMFAITGLATNSSKDTAGEVVLQADLSNHGSFVDQCTCTISGSIAPGASRHFKIRCNWENKPPVEHDSFKVLVLGSRWP